MLGAIDGSCIPALVLLESQGQFHNKKQLCTQNVMVVVGFDMKFHYILASWERSAFGSRVLYNAIDNNECPFIIPEEKYYLTNSGYPNIVGFLTPHRGYRYHLSEYNGSGAKPIER
ncbi:hypothetical protein EJ110_NYTH07997 [Nymphaea thermarum]|nr:hypothetical protein EJ110_NYTH07997 [Nymphaea thermarum]